MERLKCNNNQIHQIKILQALIWSILLRDSLGIAAEATLRAQSIALGLLRAEKKRKRTIRSMTKLGIKQTRTKKKEKKTVTKWLIFDSICNTINTRVRIHNFQAVIFNMNICKSSPSLICDFYFQECPVANDMLIYFFKAKISHIFLLK